MAWQQRASGTVRKNISCVHCIYGTRTIFSIPATSFSAARVSADLGLCPGDLPEKLLELLAAVGLPTRAELPDNETLAAAMRHDKKVSNDRIRFVLPRSLGEVEIRDDVPPASVDAGWEFIRS